MTQLETRLTRLDKILSTEPVGSNAYRLAEREKKGIQTAIREYSDKWQELDALNFAYYLGNMADYGGRI